MMGSATSGSWKNYNVAGECMCITTLLLKLLYKNGEEKKTL
jgi:hypothetical protein